MKGILKRGVVIGLIALFGSTACTEEKDDNTGLLLGALLLTQSTPTWAVTMTVRVRTAASANMAAAADNRAIQFTNGAGNPLILATNETIQYLATSAGQAGAGVVQVAFRINATPANINFGTRSLRSGGNADLIADYNVEAGSGSFIITPNDADPTNAGQVTSLTATNTNIVISAIRTVRTGTYNLESPTRGEQICDGSAVTGTPTIVSSNITSSVTWSGAVLLQGTINITGANTVVTVQPGTVVYGQRGSSLFAYDGGSISAVGTAANPICFTSANAPGSRQPGDWGGLVLIGSGFNARGATAQTEGTTPQSYPNASNSNSRFEYTIIEFAGNEVAPGDELNNLSMYSVDNSGTGPALNRVQVHRGLDDGFEWWGGNISGQFLVATGGLDDDFDADEGYGTNADGGQTATLRHLIALKYPASCGGSFSTDPSSFEMDGTQSGNTRRTCSSLSANSSTTCHTNPLVENFTIIGQNQTGGFGMQLREGMRGNFNNGLVWNFASAALNCVNTNGFAPAAVTINNIAVGQSGAVVSQGTSNCTTAGSISALPITSLGNVAGDACGFGATKPNFATISGTPNNGAQAAGGSIAGGTGAWWDGWTVYRSR